MATMTQPSDTQADMSQPSRAASAAQVCSAHLSIWECLRFARRIRRLPISTAARSIIRSIVYVCENCFLVQLEEYESAENIFSDYRLFLFLFRFMAEAL